MRRLPAIKVETDVDLAKGRAEKGVFRIEHALVVVEHVPGIIGLTALHEIAPFLSVFGALGIVFWASATILAHYGRPYLIQILGSFL